MSPPVVSAMRALRPKDVAEWLAEAADYVRGQSWASDAHPYAFDVLFIALGLKEPVNPLRDRSVSGWKGRRDVATGTYVAQPLLDEMVEAVCREARTRRKYNQVVRALWALTGEISLDEWCATHAPSELADLLELAAKLIRNVAAGTD